MSSISFHSKRRSIHDLLVTTWAFFCGLMRNNENKLGVFCNYSNLTSFRPQILPFWVDFYNPLNWLLCKSFPSMYHEGNNPHSGLHKTCAKVVLIHMNSLKNLVKSGYEKLITGSFTNQLVKSVQAWTWMSPCASVSKTVSFGPVQAAIDMLGINPFLREILFAHFFNPKAVVQVLKHF